MRIYLHSLQYFYYLVAERFRAGVFVRFIRARISSCLTSVAACVAIIFVGIPTMINIQHRISMGAGASWLGAFLSSMTLPECVVPL